jgi:hypothetical protein
MKLPDDELLEQILTGILAISIMAVYCLIQLTK